MGLTQAQRALVTKVKTGAADESGAALDDEICAYLVSVIAHDLSLLSSFPEVPDPAPFFGAQPLPRLRLSGIPFFPLLERLIGLFPDADSFFYCLATLHKARLKFERILQTQDLPTIEQVGPRGLLQFGSLPPRALVSLLFWRKWLYDIDNRAAQETGYVFEPIIAHAVGGVPYSARRSPVKRKRAETEGRQVDCIRDNRAYEIKLRVTTAASGQGRWREELDFPVDCNFSGYRPVLIVLDPTINPKLEQLRAAFLAASGEAYVGEEAWNHLANAAGPTMSRFLEIYVHAPIQTLLEEAPSVLADMLLRMENNNIIITLGGEELLLKRQRGRLIAAGNTDLPVDVDEELPG